MDASIRSRRLVREVAIYWRRAEREAIENRRRAQKEEVELARRQSEAAEVERQKKRLEFLLTQTELYSHFIGRKMGLISDKPIPHITQPNNPATAGASTSENKHDIPSSDTSTVKGTASVTDAFTTVTVPSASAVSQPNSSSESIIHVNMDDMLARASSVKNEQNISAEEAALSYIRHQYAKMREFDQLESRTMVDSSASPTAMETTDEKDSTNSNVTAIATSLSASTPPMSSTGPSVPSASDTSLDLLNPSTMPQQESFVQVAASFKGTLKSYQLRGLNCQSLEHTYMHTQIHKRSTCSYSC
jgi:SNF2 family DNA or RNA helicase